jgi:hypothetical protein
MSAHYGRFVVNGYVVLHLGLGHWEVLTGNGVCNFFRAERKARAFAMGLTNKQKAPR